MEQLALDMEADFPPKREENNISVFAAIGLANHVTVKIHTYLTVRLPVASNR